MLEIKKSVVALEPEEVMELERIMIDQDQEAAFAFLKKSIYQKIAHSQKDRLQSHLDSGDNPVEKFRTR
ncbi:MAG: hypothetical protein PHE84_13680 [bacterium]|nr:hypothetical protein [bacterium]